MLKKFIRQLKVVKEKDSLLDFSWTNIVQELEDVSGESFFVKIVLSFVLLLSEETLSLLGAAFVDGFVIHAIHALVERPVSALAQFLLEGILLGLEVLLDYLVIVSQQRPLVHDCVHGFGFFLDLSDEVCLEIPLPGLLVTVRLKFFCFDRLIVDIFTGLGDLRAVKLLLESSCLW